MDSIVYGIQSKYEISKINGNQPKYEISKIFGTLKILEIRLNVNSEIPEIQF